MGNDRMEAFSNAYAEGFTDGFRNGFNAGFDLAMEQAAQILSDVAGLEDFADLMTDMEETDFGREDGPPGI